MYVASDIDTYCSTAATTVYMCNEFDMPYRLAICGSLLTDNNLMMCLRNLLLI